MKTVLSVLILSLLAVAMPASAQNAPVPAIPSHVPVRSTIALPGADLVSINVGDTYTKAFSLNTAGIEFKSCDDPVNYQLGSCNYLFACYLILPQGCGEVACTKDYVCRKITALANPEPVTVSLSATAAEIGKSYAVAAFMLNSQMTYDFTLRKWSDVTAAIDSTRQADVVTVAGAPAPPAVDIGAFIANFINNIRNWLCVNFSLFC